MENFATVANRTPVASRPHSASTASSASASVSSASTSHTRQADQAALSESLLREYARTRDLSVRNRLVMMHMRIVHYVAGRFSGSGVPQDDLVQIGTLGLITAVERFDPARNVGFISFAIPTISGYIKRYFRDYTWTVKAPRRLRELASSIQGARRRLEQRLDRCPTVAELAVELGVSEERLIEGMEVEAVYQPVSLDVRQASAEGREGDSLGESLGAHDPALLALERDEMLNSILCHLEPRLRTVLYHRFFENATQVEVANRLGISQMHVSRLERRALEQLRKVLEA
jgi:RNA polymerase sigma-B factor